MKDDEEKRLADSVICRQIVKEIMDFGVTESQKLRILYMLSLELENRDILMSVSRVVKEALGESELIQTD